MFAMPNNRVAHIAGEIKYAFVLIVVLNSLNLHLGDRELVVIAFSPSPPHSGKGWRAREKTLRDSRPSSDLLKQHRKYW
jgi:hypothetical protein